jgi:cation diffusion facilitator CzcD-associated flavoprotein CzcO
VSSMPGNAGTEQTTTVIIGTGLSGLAVAAELRRRGVGSIVVDGLDILGAGQPANTTSLQPCGTCATMLPAMMWMSATPPAPFN